MQLNTQPAAGSFKNSIRLMKKELFLLVRELSHRRADQRARCLLPETPGQRKSQKQCLQLLYFARVQRISIARKEQLTSTPAARFREPTVHALTGACRTHCGAGWSTQLPLLVQLQQLRLAVRLHSLQNCHWPSCRHSSLWLPRKTRQEGGCQTRRAWASIATVYVSCIALQCACNISENSTVCIFAYTCQHIQSGVHAWCMLHMHAEVVVCTCALHSYHRHITTLSIRTPIASVLTTHLAFFLLLLHRIGCTQP